jgi:hypothetical protein
MKTSNRRKPGHSNLKRINTLLSADCVRILKELAKDHGGSISAAVRYCVLNQANLQRQAVSSSQLEREPA